MVAGWVPAPRPGALAEGAPAESAQDSDRRAARLLGAAVVALTVSVIVSERTLAALLPPTSAVARATPLSPEAGPHDGLDLGTRPAGPGRDLVVTPAPAAGAGPGPGPGPGPGDGGGAGASGGPADGAGAGAGAAEPPSAELLDPSPETDPAPSPESRPAAGAGSSGSLRDDDQDAALFRQPALLPGEAVVRCIQVRYEGRASTADVSLSATADGLLAKDLVLRVERGQGGGFRDCTGFVADTALFEGNLGRFAARHADEASALPVLRTTAAERGAVFRVTVQLADAATSAGSTAAARFDWHVRTDG